MAGPEQRRRLIALSACTVLAAIAVRTAWVCDDAYVSFRVVDNFVHGYGLRWNVADRVQVFTHPLWLAIVGAAYTVTREPYFTVLAISILLTVAAMYVVVARIAVHPATAVCAAVALMLSKAFVDFTTSGLETPLTYLLLTAFWAIDLRVLSTGARCEWVAVVTGLLALTDARATVLVLPALAVALWRRRSIGIRNAIAAGALPIILWALFAFVYYGALLPSPTVAWWHAGVPPFQLTRHGVVYLLDSLNLDPLTLTIVLVAVVLAATDGSRNLRGLAAGLVIYVLLVVTIGGDAMSGRLLAPAALCAAIAIGRADLSPLTPAMRLQIVAGVLGIGLISPRPLTYIRRYGEPSRPLIAEWSGIADERHRAFPTSGLLNARRDVPWPFEVDAPGGRTARETERRVVATADPGMRAFFGGPAVHVIDLRGANDPLLARLPASRPFAIGAQSRVMPDGYAVAVTGGPPTFRDPSVAALYADVKAASQDPVWSWRRLTRIVRTAAPGPSGSAR